MVEKLGTGFSYQEAYFFNEVSVKELNSSDADTPIER